MVCFETHEMQPNLFIVGWASHPSPQKEMVRTVFNCWSTFGALSALFSITV
jgi:hypothetical protein